MPKSRIARLIEYVDACLDKESIVGDVKPEQGTADDTKRFAIEFLKS